VAPRAAHQNGGQTLVSDECSLTLCMLFSLFPQVARGSERLLNACRCSVVLLGLTSEERLLSGDQTQVRLICARRLLFMWRRLNYIPLDSRTVKEIVFHSTRLLLPREFTNWHLAFVC